MDRDFTTGRILPKLLLFTLPVLGALIVQAAYGAVDLLIVGHFARALDVSAVATGTQMMWTITGVITGLSMGTTILIGQMIGAKREKEAGDAIGSAIFLFGAMGIAVALFVPLFSESLCRLMKAPAEALSATNDYVSVCSYGAVFIVAYNVLGSVFRGMGDSRTPLIAVVIASCVNVAGDYLLVAVYGLGAKGAALATAGSQGLSVAICLILIKKKGMPFTFGRRNLRWDPYTARQTLKLGFPIALQDLLVSLSFLVVMAVVNSLGLTASAGVGVAEKLCAFIMLVPSAFSQALSAFVAQNIGAKDPVRAKKALYAGMAVSFGIGVVMAYAAFFHGEGLAHLFTNERDIALAASQYLKAYAIDTLLVSFLFCFIGYYNGCGHTTFVMAQGLIGAFCVRIPVSLLMKKVTGGNLFAVGCATPCSTMVQIVICSVFMLLKGKRGADEGIAGR